MRATIELHLPHQLAAIPQHRPLAVFLLVLLLALWPLAALASDVFGDVPTALPQHDAINRVYAAGIMRACTATVPPNFCPNDPVLRAQQASQWDRALGLNGSPNAAVYVGRSRTTDTSSAYRLPGPALSTIDSAGDVGNLYSSATIGADSVGLISYYDTTNGDLKVAHCANPGCSSASLATLDATGNVGSYSSITIGADGLGLISYYDVTNGDLKAAHCTNTRCSGATLATLNSVGDVGSFTSIAIGADGLGLISYYDVSNGDLKVAHCANIACTSASLVTVDSAGNVGDFTSIAIGADGLGIISYHDTTSFQLKVAHCSNALCSAATITTLDFFNVGAHTSIAIGLDGLGLVSYYSGDSNALIVAHCLNIVCTGADHYTTVDSGGVVGGYTSITIGADGMGLISYRDVTNTALKVAHCTDQACASATLSTLDSAGDVGYFTSVTIGADGLGLISYYDNSNGDLKVAHCANLSCTPFVRRSR